jgi:adenine/guanine phosphoribosyltransferase-like PRPP-binding protein
MDVFNEITKVKTYPDFPREGVTMLGMDELVDNAPLMAKAAKAILETFCLPGDEVVGMATRGMTLATQLASIGGMRLTTAKKELKVPPEKKRVAEGASEYGKARAEVGADRAQAIVEKGSPVWVVDDVYATGGTVAAVRGVLEGANHKGVFVLVALKLGAPIPEHMHCFAYYEPATGVWTPGDLCYVPSGVISPPMPTSRRVIIAAPGAEALAMRTVFTAHIPIHPVTWGHFPDGSPNIEIPFVEYLRDREVLFFMNAVDQASLLEQIQLVSILPKQFVKSLIVYVPYLPMATMDRVDTEGTLATLDTMMKLLSKMPMTQTGPVRIMLVDPHVTSARFAAGEGALVDTVHEIAKCKFVQTADLVVFPDDGAKKRFRGMIERNGPVRRVMSFTKTRGVDGAVGLVPFDVAGASNYDELVRGAKSIVLVDDLIRSGSTLLAAVDWLEKHGASRNSVTVRVTHLASADAYRAVARLANNSIVRGVVLSMTTTQAQKVARMPELHVITSDPLDHLDFTKPDWRSPRPRDLMVFGSHARLGSFWSTKARGAFSGSPSTCRPASLVRLTTARAVKARSSAPSVPLST